MLDPLTIERALSVSRDAPIIVALSGGGDSVALLRLMLDQVAPQRLRALVVDHALRAGSRDDAKRAADFAMELGIRADILPVLWPDGARPGQAAARDARYFVLCERARDLGARVVAVAHTADDQVETVFMRATAQSSWRGLAGMASFSPAPIWPEGRGIWIARPLLNVRRAALRALLREQGAAWIEDPANANDAFERVRVRAHLAELETGGADITTMVALAARVRPHVEKLDAEAAALIKASARFDADAISIDRDRWQAPPHVRRRALSVLIASAAGESREPAADAVERLDGRLTESGFSGASLGGARLAPRRADVRIDRDPGALTGRADGAPPLASLPLLAGRQTVWDGRLQLRIDELGWSVVTDAGAPELRRGTERRAVADLVAGGHARWLLSQRAMHLLGRID